MYLKMKVDLIEKMYSVSKVNPRLAIYFPEVFAPFNMKHSTLSAFITPDLKRDNFWRVTELGPP